MKITKVCILGGSGFVGRHIAMKLSNRNIMCRIPTRRPHRHRDLKVLRGCEITQLEDLSTEHLQQQMTGCDAVINLIGILNETADNSFQNIHIDLVSRITDACMRNSVQRYLHMSALNADESSGSSLYLRSKGEGENRAHTLGGTAVMTTSFRPSVIFGPDDSFINRFQQMVRLPGPLPLACAGSQFAPVYVGDVAEAFCRALSDKATFGQSYDLCGPRVFSLEEIVKYIAWHAGVHKSVIELNDSLSRMQAKVLQLLPGKPFTMDNYLSLQTPSVCEHNGLVDLNIRPTDMDDVIPKHLRQ